MPIRNGGNTYPKCYFNFLAHTYNRKATMYELKQTLELHTQELEERFNQKQVVELKI